MKTQDLEELSWVFPAYITISVLSMLLSALIPASYYIYRKLRHHPSQIIAIISLLEVLQSYHTLVWLCPSQTYIKTLVHIQLSDVSDNAQELADIQDAFCILNNTIMFTCLFMALCYNICLSVDLFVTLYYPFISGNKRMGYYHAFALVSTAVIVCWSEVSLFEYCAAEGRREFTVPMIGIVFGLSYLVISLCVLIFAACHLRKDRGPTFQAKRSYVIRHMIYVISIFLIWTVIGFKQGALMMPQSSFYQFFSRNKSVIELIYNCSILGGGIFLASIRLTEAYYFGNVVLMLKAIFSKKAREMLLLTQKQEQTEKSYTFDQDLWNNSLLNVINSNQNTNIVKLILRAVIINLSDETTHNQLNDVAPEKVSDELLHTLSLETRTYEQDNVNLPENDVETTYIPSTLQVILQDEAEESKSETDLRLSGNLNEDEQKQPSAFESTFKSTFKERQKAETLLSSRINRSWENKEKRKSKKATFTVTEFAPKIFEYLRKIDGINASAINQSLNIYMNEKAIQKTRESTGNSGSFFFFSHDNRLVLKTLTQAEMKTLLRHLLPAYFHYITTENKSSLLSRYYAAFRVNLNGTSPINLVLIENTLGEIAPGLIRYYDLKGSLVGRRAQKKNPKTSKASLIQVSFEDPNSTFRNISESRDDRRSVLAGKDQDFLQSEDMNIVLDPAQQEALNDHLQQDVNFLEKLNLMDYSLLFGVAVNLKIGSILGELPGKNKKFKKWRKIYSTVHKEHFSFGIIDYLQVFNYTKYVESLLKSMRYKENEYSCVEPSVYASRFLNFIGRIFVSSRALLY